MKVCANVPCYNIQMFLILDHFIYTEIIHSEVVFFSGKNVCALFSNLKHVVHIFEGILQHKAR